ARSDLPLDGWHATRAAQPDARVASPATTDRDGMARDARLATRAGVAARGAAGPSARGHGADAAQPVQSHHGDLYPRGPGPGTRGGRRDRPHTSRIATPVRS